jgi:hypothetical protein
MNVFIVPHILIITEIEDNILFLGIFILLILFNFYNTELIGIGVRFPMHKAGS